MKLISCHIENFGKLRNFDYDFSSGLSEILQENGWGKSIVQVLSIMRLHLNKNLKKL